MNTKLILLACACLCTAAGHSQQAVPSPVTDYKASLFGIRSDGITMNTNSIQKAIDYIGEQGGGRLCFYVGRYRTGSIRLKSNVTLRLEEGAGLIASASPYDYDFLNGTAALIIADGQEHVAITGKGFIEGEGALLSGRIDEQTARGNLPKSRESFRPAVIYMNRCTDIRLDGILSNNAAGDVQVYERCTGLEVNGVTVISRLNPKTRGIVLDGCVGVHLTGMYIDTPSKEIALKGAVSGDVKVRESKNAAGKAL